MKSISLSSSKYIILHNNLKFHWVKHLKKQKEKKKKKKKSDISLNISKKFETIFDHRFDLIKAHN